MDQEARRKIRCAMACFTAQYATGRMPSAFSLRQIALRY